jgi:hypothetical protein
MTGVFFHASGWDENKQHPIRLQSHCQACQRIETRIRNGRDRRGIKFNSQRTLTKQQSLARRRRRHAARQRAKRNGNPFIPLSPFSEYLRGRIDLEGAAELARVTGLDASYLVRLSNQVYMDSKSGRCERRLEILLSDLDELAVRLGVDLNVIYDFSSIRRLDGRVPRVYPTRAQRRAKARHRLSESARKPSDVPDVIGEYRRRRRARKPRTA